jgi:CheY-like chemotaxis protein
MSSVASALSSASAPTASRADDKIGREDRSALLCCHEPAYQEYLAAQLRTLGFKVHHAASAAASLQRLTVRSYHLVVLLENLEGCMLENNALLQHLVALPTDERHAVYVILLCQSFGTGDELHAFAQSVDQLINYKDIAQFAELVGLRLEEHEVGNRHFQTVLREIGK